MGDWRSRMSHHSLAGGVTAPRRDPSRRNLSGSDINTHLWRGAPAVGETGRFLKSWGQRSLCGRHSRNLRRYVVKVIWKEAEKQGEQGKVVKVWLRMISLSLYWNGRFDTVNQGYLESAFALQLWKVVLNFVTSSCTFALVWKIRRCRRSSEWGSMRMRMKNTHKIKFACSDCQEGLFIFDI